MLGFAALDRRSPTVALWLVSHVETSEADSTNSVVLDLSQPEAARKAHALTRDRVVVLTPGSDASGLCLSTPQPVTLVDDLIAATRDHQRAIVAAVRSYAAGRRGQKLVEPTFPTDAAAPENWPEAPELRALELARWLSRAWTNWLVSDGERLRRTIQPRTGRTPWVMPEELNQAGLLPLPPALTDSLRPEPLGTFAAPQRDNSSVDGA